MKPRKVMVHLEVLTNLPLKELKDKQLVHDALNEIVRDDGILTVQQITVQVVKEDK
jgi:hypothetical protein